VKVLIACEFSQIVCKAFRDKGHEAYSCDILPTEGRPEWHIKDDVLAHLNDGWDMLIGHPDCTYLTVTGNKWMKPEFRERFPNRLQQREDAVTFFLLLANAPVEKICLENPVSIISSRWRKPDQYIQPWQFGDRAVKKTGLWLKNLPLLIPTNIVEPEYHIYNSTTHKSGKSKYPLQWALTGKRNWRDRARTYLGIAYAMAEQWGLL
jgi:hypothetical protein